MASSESTGAIVAAFLANMGIAGAKLVGYVITGSSSMLAESIHSAADASNQGLLVLGGRRARRPATALHPFGYGRSRYFWSFVVALVLFSAGGVFSLYEGWHKVTDPHEISSPLVAVVILALAIVFETYALLTAVGHARPFKGDKTWYRYFRTSRSPELPVLLLEDSGALLGLVFALTGILTATATGNTVWDGIGTLSIGVLLVVIAIILAVEMKSLLIGESATPEHIRRIESELGSAPGVRRLVHMQTQHIGPDELLVGAKVEFEPDLGVQRLAAAVNAAEARVRAAVPIATVIYIEPDLIPLAPPAPPSPPGPESGGRRPG